MTETDEIVERRYAQHVMYANPNLLPDELARHARLADDHDDYYAGPDIFREAIACIAILKRDLAAALTATPDGTMVVVPREAVRGHLVDATEPGPLFEDCTFSGREDIGGEV